MKQLFKNFNNSYPKRRDKSTIMTKEERKMMIKLENLKTLLKKKEEKVCSMREESKNLKMS